MDIITKIMLLIFPVFFAGLTFVLIIKHRLLKKLCSPIDFKVKINNKRLFGNNKTFLGFATMPLATLIGSLLIYPKFQSVFQIEITIPIYSLIFLTLGLAYSLGELPNSFIKRQLNIQPGQIPQNKLFKTIFAVIDQIDSLVACGFVYWVFFKIELNVIFITIIVGGFIHYQIHNLMLKLKLKKHK